MSQEICTKVITLWIVEEMILKLAAQRPELSAEQLHTAINVRADYRNLSASEIEQALTTESISAILSGQHAPIAQELINELEQIHRERSRNEQDSLYQGTCLLLLPYIVKYRSLYPEAKKCGEVEILCMMHYKTTLQVARGLELNEPNRKLIQYIDALFALIDQEYLRCHPHTDNER